MRILSFCTQSWMAAVWLGMPVLMEMRTAMTVLMHSYNNDIADVLWIWNGFEKIKVIDM